MTKITVRIPRPKDLALMTRGISIDVDGVKGTSCTEISKGVAAALGQTETQELKEDYYVAETPQIPVQEENPQDDG